MKVAELIAVLNGFPPDAELAIGAVFDAGLGHETYPMSGAHTATPSEKKEAFGSEFLPHEVVVIE